MGRKTPVIVQCHSFLIHPPSQTLAYPFFTSSTGIVPSTHPAVNPQKHGLAAVANPTDTVCPTDTRTPSRPLPAARKMHEPEALASCFQPNLENVAGLLGDLSLSLSLHVQTVLGHPSTLPRLSGKQRESFVKPGVSWSVEVFPSEWIWVPLKEI